MHSYSASTKLQADQREQLILEHLAQVRLIARRIHERLPDSVNLEDLISTGIVGLISAIDHFDPGHNVKLKTYAEYNQVPLTIPLAGGDLNTSGFDITPGGARTINQLRVFYKWPYYTDFISAKLAELPEGKTLIFATTTWRNEPFQDS